MHPEHVTRHLNAHGQWRCKDGEQKERLISLAVNCSEIEIFQKNTLNSALENENKSHFAPGSSCTTLYEGSVVYAMQPWVVLLDQLHT